MFESVSLPGSGLARELGEVRLEELDDWDLIEVMRDWERLASWVAAGQLAAIAELARRRPQRRSGGADGRADRGDPRVPQVSEFAVDEVAAALRLSRPAAGVRLYLATGLSRLPATTAALRSGNLDVPKVRAMVDAVTVLDDSATAAVERAVLPKAGRWTVGRLRAALARAVLAVDPAAAEERHEQATAGREVRVQPLPDGMAELWALLPADAATAVYAAVDTVARQASSADGRTMDARRADALVALVTGGQPAGGEPTAAVKASVQVTVPVRTALAVGAEPGELAGYGPVPASMARRLAAAASWRKVITDAAGVVVEIGRTPYTPSAALAELVRARDRTCRFPGCRQPARRCDLDHLTPWPEGPTCECNLHCLCRHHHRLKHQTQWTVRAGPGDELTWTSPSGHRYITSPAVSL